MLTLHVWKMGKPIRSRFRNIEMHSGGGVMLNCVRKVHMKTPHNLPYASSPRIVRVGSGTRAAKSD